MRSELRNDSIPGIGQVLSFQDDKGTTIELFKDWSYLGKHEQVAGIGPLKLGHVAFFTPDIQRDRGVLREGAGLPRFRLDRRFLRASCAATPIITP